MNLSTTFASLRKKVAGFSLVTLVAGMLATGVATAATANVFSDVPADAWFAEYVNGLAEMGVVDATKSTYRPGDLVNRAEMAKFAFMVSGLPKEMATEAPFKDVAMGQWYTDYIYTLSKNGIVSGDKKDGVPTGFFRPTDSLNRAEATKMLVNAAAIAEDLSGAPHFPDVKSSDWFFNFVETAFNAGIVAGYPDGNFRPANNINRAEAAKMVYLAMSPVATGFTLDSAAAASKTKVELIFSMNVDESSAEMAANYMIEDSSGAKLNVTSAEMVAGDTVHLTTSSQTEGKVYYVTAKNVMSEAGDDLANNDEVSFLGYGADVSGGDLMVKMSELTAEAASVPSGATGVQFACWDFKAGSESAMIKSLHVKRVGPGKQTDFANVYLYRGAQRLTTGRSINSETQMVEFNNINQTIAAGENAPLCLVGDLVAGATGGVHAFELNSAEDVMSNSSNMTGSFPLRGADQLITTAVTGTTTIRRNGSLDEVTISQKGARIAQFELEADGNEDQMLRRLALYVRGSVTVSDVKNLKLYAEGEATELASTSEVGQKDLATFDLGSKGFKIGRGQRKVFYVTADLSPGRDSDTIKSYLDESTDLNVVGATFGYGTRVTDSAYNGSNPSNFSEVTIKGSAFNIAFNGPSATDLSTGQKAARCLDITITNNSGESVEVKDWPVTLKIENSPALAAGGLLDGTTSNYTLIKLARLNDDGTVGGSLLGPVELVSTNSDTEQAVVLSGSASIDAGESVKAAVVFDVRSGNTAMANDKIRCTIANKQPGTLAVITGGLTGVSDAIRDINGDQLSSTSVTPASAIVGNQHTISTGALTIAVSASPSSQTYTRGTANAALAGFSFTAGSSLDQTIKSLTVTGYVKADSTTLTAFTAGGSQTDGAETSILSNIVDNNVGLYDGNTLVSEIKNINTTTGKIVFNNLNIKVAKSTTKNLVLKGNISNQAPFNSKSDQVAFGIVAGTDVIAIDGNGQNVDSTSINTTASANATQTVKMTITASGSGTTASSGSASSAAIAGTNEMEVAKWTFTSVNDNPLLKDLDLYVLNDSPAVVNNVKLYKGAGCSTAVGSVSGYTPLPNGRVEVRDLNETISTSSTYTLCAKVTTSVVNSDGVSEPTSGSNVGLALLSVSEVSSGSGENVAQRYAGAVDLNTVVASNQTGVLTAAEDSTDTTIALTMTGGASNLAAGSVIQVEGEMMLVTNNAADVLTVVRGFAGTVASAHVINSEVTLSSVARRVNAAADILAGDVYTNGTSYMLALVANPDADGADNLSGYGPDLVCGTADDIAADLADNQAECLKIGNGQLLAAAANQARFPLHGNMSKLYRSVPQISAASTGITGPGTDAVLVDLNVSAVGDKVRFSNAQGNTLRVNISKSVAGIASTCDLVQAGGPGAPKTLDTGVVLPAAAGTSTLVFPFASNELSIDAGDTARLEVRCNTINALSGGAAGSSISGSVPSAANTVEWGDYVFLSGGLNNIAGAGQFIVPIQIVGKSVTL